MSHIAGLIGITVFGGIFVTLQAQLMGVLDKEIGTIESVFITYGGGGLLVGLTMLLLRGGNLTAVSTVPWYTLMTGAAGLIIVGSIGFTTPRLGLVPAMVTLVAAQFISAAIIDHYGWLGATVNLMTPLSTLRYGHYYHWNLVDHPVMAPLQINPHVIKGTSR